MTTIARRIFHGTRTYRLLTLYRYVAVDLPRGTSAVLVAVLLGLAATHVYALASEPAVPVYPVVYAWLVVTVCIGTSAAIAAGPASTARAGRGVGAVVCAGFLIGYLVSRLAGLPALPSVRGWWDWAPGTLAGLCAFTYLAVEGTVVLGMAVARPQRRSWHD